MPFKRQAELIANKQKRDKTVNTLICIENCSPSAAIYSTCCTKSYKYFKLSVIRESENEFNASKAASAIIDARTTN
jgi:hypothetical protein